MPPDPIGGVLRNLITLQRLGTGVNVEVQEIIRGLFDELAAQIARLDPTAPSQERWRRARLQALLGEVETLVTHKQTFEMIQVKIFVCVINICL